MGQILKPKYIALSTICKFTDLVSAHDLDDGKRSSRVADQVSTHNEHITT